MFSTTSRNFKKGDRATGMNVISVLVNRSATAI